MHCIYAVNRGPIGSDYPVTDSDIGGFGRAIGLTSDHLEGTIYRQVQGTYETPFQNPVPSHNPQIDPSYTSKGEDLSQYPLSRTGRNRKTDTLCLRDDRGIDTNDPTGGVDQRTAGIAGRAAVCWTIPSISRPWRVLSDRPRALTTPAETVDSNP